MNDYIFILKIGAFNLSLYATDPKPELWIDNNHPIRKNRWLLRLIMLFCGGFGIRPYRKDPPTHFIFISQQGRDQCRWLIGEKQLTATEDDIPF